jgi:hypothetical protein
MQHGWEEEGWPSNKGKTTMGGLKSLGQISGTERDDDAHISRPPNDTTPSPHVDDL